MERTWLQQYPEGVSADVKADEATTLLSIYADSCQKYADLPAFTCQNTTMSYRQLWERSSQFASFLQHELKLKKGQRIAIMLPNLLQYPVVLFGAFQAGLTVVNINPLYKARALEHQLRDSETDAIVVLENFIGELERAIQKTEVKHVIVTSVGDLYSFAKRHVVNFIVRRSIDKSVHSQLTMTSLKKALYIGQQQRYREVLVESADIAFLQYTGGTTGLAKGAILSHGNLVANVYQTYEWLKAVPKIQTTEQLSIITALPLYHIFSLECNCLLFLNLGGRNILIPNPRDIPSLVKVLKKTPFHFVSGVNTLFNALVRHAEFKQVNFSKLLAVVGGGMAVQQSVADQWEKITGVPICQAYGMTETSCAVTINPVGDSFNGSIGLPISSTFVSVRREDESIAKAGEHGEICIKGPQVMRGYWKDAKATIAAFTQDGIF
ncbi:AMP-binding protein [Piscirickettsia litoralis]|nr:AMP-binding protein [Piscirickettsia litoralis]